jgi:hypothetical protein
MTICIAVAATRPNTLVAAQASVREMDMVAIGHGNNMKRELMDTSVRSWDDKPKGTCNYQNHHEKDTDKRLLKS